MIDVGFKSATILGLFLCTCIGTNSFCLYNFQVQRDEVMDEQLDPVPSPPHVRIRAHGRPKRKAEEHHTNYTDELLILERSKVRIMEQQLEVDRERLEVERERVDIDKNILGQLEKLNRHFELKDI